MILHVLSRKIAVPYECFPRDPSIGNPIAFAHQRSTEPNGVVPRGEEFFLPKLQAFFLHCEYCIFTETHLGGGNSNISYVHLYLGKMNPI